MKDGMRIGVVGIVLAGLLGCQTEARNDSAMRAAEERAYQENLVNLHRRHMPHQAEEVAALLDEYLAREARPMRGELVPVCNDRGMHWAWVIRIEGRTEGVVTADPIRRAEPATRAAKGAASEAVARARGFIAEHCEHLAEGRRGERAVAREKGHNEPPIPPERLTGEYQERVYGVQITDLELVDPKEMKWKITAEPARKQTLGGEIWMHFTARTRISAEFGR